MGNTDSKNLTEFGGAVGAVSGVTASAAWLDVESQSLILDIKPNVTSHYNENEKENELEKEKTENENQIRMQDENENAEAERSAHTPPMAVINIQNDNKEDSGIQVRTENDLSSSAYGQERNKCADDSTTTAAAPLTQSSLRRMPTLVVEQSLEEFKQELAARRLARQSTIQQLRDEINSLRTQLDEERMLSTNLLLLAHQQQDDDGDVERWQHERGRNANIELAEAQLALQLATADNLTLRSELEAIRKQVGSLKEVIACCKQMLAVKEEQCAQLKSKLTEIENSLSEREMKLLSGDLRAEYERQLANMRQLRELYQQRQTIAANEYANLEKLIAIKKDELIAEQEKAKEIEARNAALQLEVSEAHVQLDGLREEYSALKYEKMSLTDEMSVVNTLFTQLIMGFNGADNLDIDRLTVMLEDNRELLGTIMRQEGSCIDGAILPKLLFELVASTTQAETMADATNNTLQENDHVAVEANNNNLLADLNANSNMATSKEIIGNLPKVWKVMQELLSHHKDEKTLGDDDLQQATTDTSKKATEPSVSKTYLKLKDLILEKKSLLRETKHLKTLNSHLESRLGEQEERLGAVSMELTRTWHMVGKMQRQHRQFHTQEQILRYQLQQKRRYLHELKDDLETCRRKWAAARAKNNQSQEQCDDLRREFQRRKLKDACLSDACLSAESGYSGDSGPQTDNEDDEYSDDGQDEVDTAGQAAGSEDAGEAPAPLSSRARRRALRRRFEHTRKLKRMQSSSPLRNALLYGEEISEQSAVTLRLRRRHSAPPSLQRDSVELTEDRTVGDSATAIETLEEECQSLIDQVLETSINRERLEMRLSDFQHEIAPDADAAEAGLPALPVLEQLISGDLCNERMARASSVPAMGHTLTPREEEYTRKRSERLERLEEESRQLMSRIQRTTDRGHYLRSSLDRVRHSHRRQDTPTELEDNADEVPAEAVEMQLLSEAEQDALQRRTIRLARLERESSQLMTQLSRNVQRADTLGSRLTHLHEQYHSEGAMGADGVTGGATKIVPIADCIEHLVRASDKRDARLQSLEEQGDALLKHLAKTLERGTNMINKINERETTRKRQNSPKPTAARVRVAAAKASVVTSAPVAETSTPSTSQGAIPKATSRPTAVLCASKRQNRHQETTTSTHAPTEAPESLESMIKRLQALPFPGTTIATKPEEDDQKQELSTGDRTQDDNEDETSK